MLIMGCKSSAIKKIITKITNTEKDPGRLKRNSRNNNNRIMRIS